MVTADAVANKLSSRLLTADAAVPQTKMFSVSRKTGLKILILFQF